MRQLVKLAVVTLLLPPLALLTACGGSGSSTSTVPATKPTGSGSSGAPVSLSVQGTLLPNAIAYQSGTSGAWTSVTASNGKVSFSLPTSTSEYSVAFACNPPGTNLSFATVLEATTADSPIVFCPDALQPSTPATLFINTQGWGTPMSVQVAQQPGSNALGGTYTGTTGGTLVASSNWASVPSDIVAFIFDPSTNLAWDVQIDRDLALTAGQSLTLAPMVGQSNPLPSAPLGMPPTLPAGYTAVYSQPFWVLADGSTAFPPQSNANTIPLIPPSMIQAGDYYTSWAEVSNASGALYDEIAGSTPTLNNVFPAPYTPVAVTPADLPSVTFSYSGFTFTGTTYREIAMSYGTKFIKVIASPSYLGSSTTVTTPDLSAVSGFFAKPSSGQNVSVHPWIFESTFPAWQYAIDGVSDWNHPPSGGHIQAVTYSAPAFAAP